MEQGKAASVEQEDIRTEGDQGAPPWLSEDRLWHTYRWFLRRRFGGTVYRASIDAGFTCPNVDGRVARGGCVYCDSRSFTPIDRRAYRAVEEQLQRQMEVLGRRRDRGTYLAYFQAATNTYTSTEQLRQMWEAATRPAEVHGIIVGTRPDCVPDDVLDLLEEFAGRMYVGVEYGLQTIHDRSLRWMNRGHDAATFFDAVERSRGRGLDVSAHVILGLPGEDQGDMLATARALGACGIDGVKIHNLHVTRHTALETSYRKGDITVPDEQAYVEMLIPFLEHLPPEMVVHRVMGDCPADYLVAPDWILHKAAFLQRLRAEMRRRQTFQGRLHAGRTS